jgi:hypothetical protein
MISISEKLGNFMYRKPKFEQFLDGLVQTFVSPGAIEINQRSICTKTDAVGYIGKTQTGAKDPFKKVNFIKIVRKLRNYSSS